MDRKMGMGMKKGDGKGGDGQGRIQAIVGPFGGRGYYFIC